MLSEPDAVGKEPSDDALGRGEYEGVGVPWEGGPLEIGDTIDGLEEGEVVPSTGTLVLGEGAAATL